MDRIRLETKHVSIEFPGVKALDDINFEVSTGEIRAVVGANGAGKSTLMKVLAGANSTYTGVSRGARPWTGCISAAIRWMSMNWCRTCPWPRSRWCS